MGGLSNILPGEVASAYGAWISCSARLSAISPWSIAVAIAPNTYPGGSKERVRKAGNAVRARTANLEDLAVIDLWRAAHRPVLNTFQAILRARTRNTGIVVAQRHKRRSTIFDKLDRLSSMQLHRMDDVAGCRLIFEDIKSLHAFRDNFHKAKFHHRLKNDVDKYDYIKTPKMTGYRGIHDIYEYDVNSVTGIPYKGLFIEIQYRTKYQHAWATCVEVIGFITENNPKFEKGDGRYIEILALSSEIISRAFEDREGPLPDLAKKALVKQFLDLDKEIGFISLLKSLNTSQNKKDFKKNKNAILIFQEGKALEVRSFRDATDALRALFVLEREMADNERDIVLVRADTTEEIRIAFKNYFNDASDFIDLIEEGCHRLSGKVFLHAESLEWVGGDEGGHPNDA